MLSRGRVRAAIALAFAVDFLQLSFLPVLLPIEAAIWPIADIVDVVMAIVLTLLVGWHWAFLPSFIFEALPFAEFAPTWWIAVLIATRGRTDLPNMPAAPPIPPIPPSDGEVIDITPRRDTSRS
jgi:hypothetical protein